MVDNARTHRDILIVEDDVSTARAISAILERQGYQSNYSLNLKDAIASIETSCPKLVLLDLTLPDGHALSELARFKRLGVQEIIVISGTDSPEHTRQCLTAGAFDFIPKPANAALILASVRRAVTLLKIEQLNPGTYPFVLSPGFGSLEGRSDASITLFQKIRQAGKSLSPGACIVTGPPGVMKNDIAASIQHYGHNTGSAYLINCAGENDDNAVMRFTTLLKTPEMPAQGYFAKAQQGALVLDDVSALRLELQRMIADYISTWRFTAWGAKQSQVGSASIIGVLKEDPHEAIEQGRLDPNLYQQLSKNSVQVPSLRQRSEDIEFFAHHAVAQLNAVFDTEKGISTGLMKELQHYSWPGDLLEFRNLILMGYRLTEPGEEISADGLLFSQDEAVVNSSIAPFIGLSLRSAEQKLIEATLAEYENNKRKVAEILGVSVKTLYNRLKSYEQSTTV